MRAGIDRDTAYGAVTPPIVLSSNFSFAGFDEKRQYDYTRSGNPTRDLLGEALAELEGGAGGVVTATGMGAITLVLHALLKPGDRLVVPHDGYGGSWRLFNALATQGRVRTDHRRPDRSARADRGAGAATRRVVWIETPSNPLLRITDLRFVIDAAQARRRARRWSTTPSCRRRCSSRSRSAPISSCIRPPSTSTATATSSAARWSRAMPEQHEQLVWWANALGLTGSPFDSFLTLRGLRTLDARLRVHQENTQALVALLDAHPAVRAVHYPGLASHPGHALAARQQDGFGAMLSVELDGGEDAVRAFVDGLQCFTLAESLGGVESLVAHPATMTHAAMSPEARAAAGIGDGLLRLSVGIEHVDDLRRRHRRRAGARRAGGRRRSQRAKR